MQAIIFISLIFSLYMCLSLSVNFGQLAKPYKDRFHFNSLHIGYSKFISTQYEYPLLCSFLFVSIIFVPLKITKWHFLFPHLMFELSFSLFRLDPIITNNPTSGAKKTSVSFSKNSDVSLFSNDFYWPAVMLFTSVF